MKPSFLLFSVSVSILIIISPVITQYYRYSDYEDENSESDYGSNFENYEDYELYEDRNSKYLNYGHYGDGYFESYGNGNSWNWWNWQYWWNLRDWERWNRLWDAYGITKTISKDVVPLTQLRVRTADNKEVYTGQTVNGARTFLILPHVEWPCDPNKFYILVFLDLDVPLLRDGYQYLHWRVDGIRGCGGVKSGVVTYPYLTGPTALPATGVNRYAILVFETNEYFTGDLKTEVRSVAGRNNFNAKKFIGIYGRPFAGTFFMEKSPVAGNINLFKSLPKPNPILPNL